MDFLNQLRQRISSVEPILEWSYEAKTALLITLLVCLLMLCLFFLGFVGYIDTAHVYIKAEGAQSLATFILLVLGCIGVFYCLLWLSSRQSNPYVQFIVVSCVLASSGVFMAILTSFFGSFNFATGVVSSSAALFSVIIFSKRFSVFVLLLFTLVCTAVLLWVNSRYLDITRVFSVPFMEDPRFILPDTLTTLFFGVPPLIIFFFLFRHVIEYWRQRELETLRLSELDALTNVYNRRKVMQLLDAKSQKAAQSAEPLCVVTMDIDHFKRVNDTYGHVVGDAVIEYVVGLMKQRFADAGCIGRLGGEEFLVVFQHVNKDSCQGLVEQCRSDIEKNTICVQGYHVRTTASFGLAFFYKPMSINQMLHESDRLLYQAKEKGRNCVISDCFYA